MPSVKKGEKQGDYMHRCVPLLKKEGKNQDQAVAECLNMFKEHWHAKGNTWPTDEKEAAKLIESFSFDECPECLKRERKQGIWSLDMTKKYE